MNANGNFLGVSFRGSGVMEVVQGTYSQLQTSRGSTLGDIKRVTPEKFVVLCFRTCLFLVRVVRALEAIPACTGLEARIRPGRVASPSTGTLTTVNLERPVGLVCMSLD